MAALHTTPDSPASQLERAEDGLECDPDLEDEEEEKGEEAEIEEEEEEEIVVEEEDEEEPEEEEAGHVEQVEVELEEDETVEEVVAEEQSLELGTQECLSRGGDAKASVLQDKGTRGASPWEGRKGAWVGCLGELFGSVGWSRSTGPCLEME